MVLNSSGSAFPLGFAMARDQRAQPQHQSFSSSSPSDLIPSAESGAVEADGAVAGRDVERLAAAIQFAANGTATGVSLHLKRNSDTDVAVVGMCIDIGLEIVGKGERDAGVDGMNRPRGRYFGARQGTDLRSEEHTSELQSPDPLVCRLLLA